MADSSALNSADESSTDPKSFAWMMWHIGQAVLVAGSLVTLMMGFALLRGSSPVCCSAKGKGGYYISNRAWATLLLPNVVMHVCGGMEVGT